MTFSNPFWLPNNPFSWAWCCSPHFLGIHFHWNAPVFQSFHYFSPSLCLSLLCAPASSPLPYLSVLLFRSFSFFSCGCFSVCFLSLFFFSFSPRDPIFFPLPLFRFSLFSFLNSCGTLRGRKKGEGEGREVSFSQSCRTKLPPTPHAVSPGMGLSVTWRHSLPPMCTSRITTLQGTGLRPADVATAVLGGSRLRLSCVGSGCRCHVATGDVVVC